MQVINAILFILLQLSGWELLSTVSIVRRYDEMMGQEIDAPLFTESLLSHAGESITLSGYVIPLEVGLDHDYFVLSRFPYQSCFFCGAAGPETVVEVYPIEKLPKIMPDQRITVSGTLEINQNDPLHLFYVIKDASVDTD